jgi:hypothetical protein
MEATLLLGILLNLYVVPLGIIIAAAMALYWALVWFLFAGRVTALVLSATVSVLGIPMLIVGHGIGLIPLALGVLSGHSAFLGWSVLTAPPIGWLTYWLLGRVWVVTVYEPASGEVEEKVRPWEIPS